MLPVLFDIFLVTCASNPCNLVTGSFDATNGYCCYDVPPTYTDSVCTCPNNVQPVLNGPCRKKSKKNNLKRLVYFDHIQVLVQV
jgi:hypothetical protein